MASVEDHVDDASSVRDESCKVESKPELEDQSVNSSDKAEKLDGRQSDNSEKKSKIDVLLKPTGDAPIMKKKKWAVNPTQNIGSIIEFMRKYLKLESSESLFLYINQAFAPSPDQVISNLFECFGSDGKLVLHYAKSQAWG